MKIISQVLKILQDAAGKNVKNSEMMRQINTSEQSICRAIRSLEKGGYISRPGRGKYVLTEKGRTINPADVIDARGLDSRSEYEQHGIRELWWRHLRFQKIATPADAIPLLLEAGSVTPHIYQDVNRYCYALEQAGYIECYDKERPKIKRKVRWRLVKDTGIHSPKLCVGRLKLIDRNNGEAWDVKK